MLRFLTLNGVIRLHEQAIEKYGGAHGIRDRGLLISSLEQPKMALHYGVTDVCKLAAYYGFSLCKNHPFLDGNKRTSHQAMATFLSLNNMRFVASEEECITIMLDLANNKLEKDQLAQWLRTVTIVKDIKQKD